MIVRSVSRVQSRRNPEIHQSNGLPITWAITTNCVEICYFTDSILHLVVCMKLLKTSVFTHWKKLPFHFCLKLCKKYRLMCDIFVSLNHKYDAQKL